MALALLSLSVPKSVSVVLRRFCRVPPVSTKVCLKLGKSDYATLQIKSRAKTIPRNPVPEEVCQTTVAKDVLLFSYNKPQMFVVMKCFGVVAFLACLYMAETCYATLRDIGRASEKRSKMHPMLSSSIPESLHWWEKVNFGHDVVRGGLALILVGAGSCVAFYCTILLPSRTVRALVLIRGGHNLGISTYASFGSGKYMVVPRQEVVPQRFRNQTDYSRPTAPDLPLKVQGRRFYYMLNSRGHFHNGQLFDHLFSTGLSWR